MIVRARRLRPEIFLLWVFLWSEGLDQTGSASNSWGSTPGRWPLSELQPSDPLHGISRVRAQRSPPGIQSISLYPYQMLPYTTVLVCSSQWKRSSQYCFAPCSLTILFLSCLAPVSLLLGLLQLLILSRLGTQLWQKLVESLVGQIRKVTHQKLLDDLLPLKGGRRWKNTMQSCTRHNVERCSSLALQQRTARVKLYKCRGWKEKLKTELSSP